MKHNRFIRCLSFLCLLPLLLIISACSSNELSEEIRHATLEDVSVIHIDHGSTPLQLEVSDTDSLRASLTLASNKGGIIIEDYQSELTIRLKSHMAGLVNIGRKTQLRIGIPSHYEGKVVVKGSSGNVTGVGLRSHSLDIQGKSGNITLENSELNNNLHVSVHSGNVRLRLNDNIPDATWRLQTTSGRRSIDFPLDGQREQKRRIEGTTGDGTHQVNIEAKSGSITVE